MADRIKGFAEIEKDKYSEHAMISSTLDIVHNLDQGSMRAETLPEGRQKRIEKTLLSK